MALQPIRPTRLRYSFSVALACTGPQGQKRRRPRLCLHRIGRASLARAAQPGLLRRQQAGSAQKREQVGRHRSDQGEVQDQRKGSSLRESLSPRLRDHEELLPRVLRRQGRATEGKATGSPTRGVPLLLQGPLWPDRRLLPGIAEAPDRVAALDATSPSSASALDHGTGTTVMDWGVPAHRRQAQLTRWHEGVRGSVCGRAPVEPREAREVAVEADPLAARLDRERCQVRVGCQIADGVDSPTEVGEQCPVAVTGSDDTCVGPGAKTVTEVEGLTERGRRVQRAAVRGDAHEGAEDELGESEGAHVPGGVFEQIAATSWSPCSMRWALSSTLTSKRITRCSRGCRPALHCCSDRRRALAPYHERSGLGRARTSPPRHMRPVPSAAPPQSRGPATFRVPQRAAKGTEHFVIELNSRAHASSVAPPHKCVAQPFVQTTVVARNQPTKVACDHLAPTPIRPAETSPSVSHG